jgi:hypothetical protein
MDGGDVLAFIPFDALDSNLREGRMSGYRTKKGASEAALIDALQWQRWP